MTGDADSAGFPWGDADRPHDESISQMQIDELLRRLAPAPKRVLDLGCGAGRVLVPLAAAGHEITGLDRDEDALARCRANLAAAGSAARLLAADFVTAWPATDTSYDAVLCLGNTIMTVADVDRAVDLLRSAADALGGGGFIAIDDCSGDFWPEVGDGNWQSGLSPDGDGQMVWAKSDAVFALRRGARVDAGDWSIGARDEPLRLWSDGALRLLARAAGLAGPSRVGGHLLLMTPSLE